jgi:hypothetical protein
MLKDKTPSEIEAMTFELPPYIEIRDKAHGGAEFLKNAMNVELGRAILRLGRRAQ